MNIGLATASSIRVEAQAADRLRELLGAGKIAGAGNLWFMARTNDANDPGGDPVNTGSGAGASSGSQQAPQRIIITDKSDGRKYVYELAPGGSSTKVGPIPFGFKTTEAYNEFGKTLHEGLAKAGYREAQPMFQGSSVTGKAWNEAEKAHTGAAFDLGRVSDFDIAIADPSLFARARQLGIEIWGGNRTHPLTAVDLKQLGLDTLVDSLSKQAGGRPVRFMVFGSADAAKAKKP